ncbi:MAG: alkane 1-monooxygenase [Pseudomonadota bacterium]
MSSSDAPALARRAGFVHALPFWVVYVVPCLVLWAALSGGWVILLVPLAAWHVATLLDALLGRDRGGLDPDTTDAELFWHTLCIRLWMPIQLATMAAVLLLVPGAAHLTVLEQVGIFFGLGVMTGTFGITIAHELMHRPTRLDRWLADLLMAMVFYSHFRSEHLLVHHRYVGTPRDAVTAKYNEGFHRFFARVLLGTPGSAWAAEKALLRRKSLPAWHQTNPFWRYVALQGALVLAALLLAGWLGLALVAFQAFVAVWQLEMVNYVEHYGLTRRHLGEGKYEPVKPHHSWNATHTATNWLLINLQRHSDHHAKPARPFPLLQAHTPQTAPELPYGYPVMTLISLIPPLWRRLMNPRVRAWRSAHYPDISDWAPYSEHATPAPR